MLSLLEGVDFGWPLFLWPFFLNKTFGEDVFLSTVAMMSLGPSRDSVIIPDLYIQDYSFFNSQPFQFHAQPLSLEPYHSITVARSRYHQWSPLSDWSFWNKYLGPGTENHSPEPCSLVISCDKGTLSLLLWLISVETFSRQWRYFRIREPPKRKIRHTIPFSLMEAYGSYTHLPISFQDQLCLLKVLEGLAFIRPCMTPTACLREIMV